MQWPQARKRAAGLVEHGKCMLCFADECRKREVAWPPEEGDAAADEALNAAPLGALAHRHWLCARRSDSRQLEAPAAMCGQAEEESIVGAQAFERAIYPALDDEVPAPPSEPTFVWVLRPPGGAYQGTIYTDGSHIDGHNPRTARNGWSLVVLNETGRAIAIAMGVSPGWISDIPGTEAWALLQAATGAEPGRSVRVDCLPCVIAVFNGLAWATTDKRKHARVHSMLLKARCDLGPDRLTWMRAHCSDAKAGVALKGDGTAVTILDIRGNRAAGKYAKLAASTCRVPEKIRLRLQRQKA